MTLHLLTQQSAYTHAMQLIARAMRPDPPLWVDQWAEDHMRIPPDTGAAEPGPYRVARTPFAREVMRCLSPERPCQRVVVMGASQLLKTQTFLNAALAWIDGAPANIIALMPSGELAKRLSARVDKTIKAIPRVAERVAKPRSRDARNTINAKDFRGGTLFCLTAGTAKNLAETSARYGYFDEIDRAEGNVQQEGDPVKLFENRFATYGRRKKLYYTSSPTLDETSRIKTLYEQGDQRKFLVHCVHCDHPHELVWANLAYDGGEATMICPECGGVHTERDKTALLASGHWQASTDGDGGETVSFHISALYAPFGWVSWTDLAKEHAEAKRAMEQGDDEQMQVFYNTRLALPWAVAKATTSAKALKAKAEQEALPSQIVPAWALVVTAAVDTQGDRLEYKAIAWGEGMEHAIIDKRILSGSPAEDAVWSALDELHRTVRYARADGHPAHQVAAMFVDSGGHHTQDVYNFCRHRKHRHIYAIKGASRPGRSILATSPSKADVNWRGRMEKHGALVWIIGTDTAKDWIAARLLKEPGPGAAHFAADLSDDDFEQITAEYRVARLSKGHKIVEWHKKKNQRNEGLDLYVYNLAAAHYLGLHKMREAQWAALRAKVCPPEDLVSRAERPPAPIAATAPGVLPAAQPTTPRPAPTAAPTSPFAKPEWSSRL
jgi:phage terminase large subunit GpA-like protein